MKQFLLSLLIGCTLFRAGAGSSFYINNGTVVSAPVIDATNFVNNGSFTVSTLLLPYDFSNTRNFTNRGVMDGFPGFRFDTAFPNTGQRIMAANFYNAGFGSSFVSNGSVTASSQLLISATNVINRGALTVGSSGLLSIQGKNLDLSRGILTAQDTLGSGQQFFDQYWGIGTNRINPALNAVSTLPTTPAHQVISQLIKGFYFTNRANVLSLAPGIGATPSLVATQLVSELDSNRMVQIVFVNNNPFNPNTNLNVAISFLGGTPTEFGIPVIDWSAIGVDTTGMPLTNHLYLTDTFGSNPTNAFITNRLSGVTLQPQNFAFSLPAAPQSFVGNPAAAGYTDPAPTFWGTPRTATNLYSAWSVNIANANFDTTSPTLARYSPGRIEIVGDKSVDLNLARISANTYLKIESTNHFKGASNAQISALYSDINIGSTNGQLKIANLLSPSIPRISGTVSLYSAVWTNDVFFNGSTNRVGFNILYVDSELSIEQPAQQLAVNVRSTNVVLNDTMNIVESLNLNVDNLTIADTGVINLQSADNLNWAVNAPHLKNLTNNGSIVGVTVLDFSARNASGQTVSYQSLVNAGSISATGLSADANRIVNSGAIFVDYGQIFLRGANVDLQDGGYLYGYESDVTIEAGNLAVTNHNVWPGRAISLSVTNSLISGPNFWPVYAGFNLWKKPVTGDLAETEIYDYGYDYAEVLHTWAGRDLGPTPAGFTNNTALGALDLDGGLYTLFTFSGAGPSSNALYVDTLYLLNGAAEIDADGNLVSLNLNPGMKLYYGKIFVDDGNGGLTEITASLNGKNGGALVNVPHDGPLSVASSIPPVALKVSIQPTPSPRALISWNAVPKATYWLYYMDAAAGNWQLFTNFAASGSSSTETVVDSNMSSGRFYRLRIGQH
ncbi:MAG: hypothetical protein RLY20_1537 [Verrucomicrobiota bacterium]